MPAHMLLVFWERVFLFQVQLFPLAFHQGFLVW